MPHVIIWQDGRPDLLCSGGKNGVYDVINGGWTLKIISATEYRIEEKGWVRKYDKITTAPEGGDYNAILEKVRCASEDRLNGKG